MPFVKGHPNYLKYHSEETKKRLSELNKGKTHSEETRKRLSLSHLGKPNPRKGINTLPFCLDCNIKLKDHRSKRCYKCNTKIAPNAYKKGQVSPRKGIKMTPEQIEKNRQKRLGKKHSIETRRKMSEAQKRVIAEGRHHFWKGGIDKAKHSERYALMKTIEYKLWREAVFKRDNYTCQMCSQYGGYLEADHIKPWNSYPELRFAIDNGRTLCRPCHQMTDTWGGRSLKEVANYA